MFLKRIQVHSDRFTEMVQISLINCLLFLNISVLSVIWLYTKNLLFWTLQKSNQYFVFKTTYLFSKVIVPKHKNWRWIQQRAFQDPSSYICPGSLSALSACSQPYMGFWAGAKYKMAYHWLRYPTDLAPSTPLAGRGKYNMDFEGAYTLSGPSS